VNNARMPDAQYATKMSVELIDQVFDTNLRGPWLLSCEVARRLMERKAPGRIVNLSSMGAHHYAGRGAALYSTTKAAVERMTEVQAVVGAGLGLHADARGPGGGGAAFPGGGQDGPPPRLRARGSRPA